MTEISKKQNFTARYGWIFWGIIVVFLYIWSLTGLQFSGLQESAGEVSKSIINGLFHPEWS